MNNKSKLIDITGKKFNRLTVLSFSHLGKRNKAYWKCLCDCGRIIVTRGDGIKSSHTKSCGCQKIKSASVVSYKEMLGNKFGRLLVIEKTSKRGIGRNIYWRCKCDCGKIKVISGNSLRNGATKSCGCLHHDTVWRGGETRKDYPKIWTIKLKSFIRSLDGHKCQFPDCNYSDLEEKCKLHVHHIDGNKKNCETYNLISLCGSHHKHIEKSGSNKWINYFYNITFGGHNENCRFMPYS